MKNDSYCSDAASCLYGKNANYVLTIIKKKCIIPSMSDYSQKGSKTNEKKCMYSCADIVMHHSCRSR